MPDDPAVALAPLLRGRVCVLCVGNRDRGDDGAGPALAERLLARGATRCFDGGTAPENRLEAVVRERPDVVLLVDAAEYGGAPGEVRLADPADCAGGTSTHAPSLALAAAYLRARCGAEVRLLAIQAGTVAPGRTLSGPVRAAVDAWADRLAAAGEDAGAALP